MESLESIVAEKVRNSNSVAEKAFPSDPTVIDSPTMRILLSNDDGIMAPGLAALRSALSDLGEVVVVAPSTQQSAASHGITFDQPLTVQRVEVLAAESFIGMSVDGMPADCVRLALRKLLDDQPDIVVSGINAGANVGMHVFYSGTVAAAAEAAISGIPAVAFSAKLANEELDFQRIAGYCRWVLDELLSTGLGPGDLMNVNIPTLTQDGPKGIRVTPQSTADVEEHYESISGTDELERYQLRHYHFEAGLDENDVDWLEDGYITITPLQPDRTDQVRLANLSQREWPELPAQL